jgi:hypothetical protein
MNYLVTYLALRNDFPMCTKCALSHVTVYIYIYRVFIARANQTSQYMVPRCGIFLGKWRSSSAGNSYGKLNVQSACALNTRYMIIFLEVMRKIIFAKNASVS